MKPWRILEGDCEARLGELPDASAHVVFTSPPYWGLRAYEGGEGMIGLEPTLDAYLARLVAVFREVRRVLRPDGVLWLNLGDCWAANGKGQNVPQTKNLRTGYPSTQGHRLPQPGLKSKDLLGVPWAVAFALRADGWWLRAAVTWEKPNAMPGSQEDRPTATTEQVFLLTRSPRYFYDRFAVMERAKKPRKAVPGSRADVDRDAAHGSAKQDALGLRTYAGFNARYEAASLRPLRDCWRVVPDPCRFDHFATFPRRLAEIGIRLGSSERGACPACGAPWRRVVSIDRNFRSGSGRSGRDPVGKHGPRLQGGGETRDVRRGPVTEVQTLGWAPTCKPGCPGRDAEPVPCTVLDPFAGVGTAGLAALALHRRFVGVEISEKYADIARRRLRVEGAQVEAFPALSPPLVLYAPARETAAPEQGEMFEEPGT